MEGIAEVAVAPADLPRRVRQLAHTLGRQLPQHAVEPLELSGDGFREEVRVPAGEPGEVGLPPGGADPHRLGHQEHARPAGAREGGVGTDVALEGGDGIRSNPRLPLDGGSRLVQGLPGVGRSAPQVPQPFHQQRAVEP